MRGDFVSNDLSMRGRRRRNLRLDFWWSRYVTNHNEGKCNLLSFSNLVASLGPGLSSVQPDLDDDSFLRTALRLRIKGIFDAPCLQ